MRTTLNMIWDAETTLLKKLQKGKPDALQLQIEGMYT